MATTPTIDRPTKRTAPTCPTCGLPLDFRARMRGGDCGWCRPFATRIVRPSIALDAAE